MDVARRPVAADLFSGAGGLSLGFEQAGFDILASIEYDPIHTAVHAFNFPRTEVVCTDICHVTADQVEAAARKGWAAHGRKQPWDGQLDVLIGGPPCQGFSVIGKRCFEDSRNQLVFNFARLVAELKPRYFVMENVPGMASLPSEPGDDTPLLIDQLLERLRGAGYEVPEPEVLNATEWGVPQDRRRLILLGTLQGQEPLKYPDEPETRPLGKQATLAAVSDAQAPWCPTVSAAIGDLPDLDEFSTLKFCDEMALDRAEVDAMEKAASPYVRKLRGLDEDARDRSWPRAWDMQALTSSLRTIHNANVVERFDTTAAGRPEPVSRLFRLDPKGACCTLRAGTHYERGSFNAPRPIHPTLPRVISVREAARLHSFPDWFRFHWTKWHGFRQVGNALPPLLARALAQKVVDVMALNPPQPEQTIDLGDPALLYLENLEAAERFGADLDRMPRNALRTRKRPPQPEEVTGAAA